MILVAWCQVVSTLEDDEYDYGWPLNESFSFWRGNRNEVKENEEKEEAKEKKRGGGGGLSPCDRLSLRTCPAVDRFGARRGPTTNQRRDTACSRARRVFPHHTIWHKDSLTKAHTHTHPFFLLVFAITSGSRKLLARALTVFAYLG